MLCLTLCEYLLELFRNVSVNLVFVSSVRLLLMYSFKGRRPFNAYLIYFTFKPGFLKPITTTTTTNFESKQSD